MSGGPKSYWAWIWASSFSFFPIVTDENNIYCAELRPNKYIHGPLEATKKLFDIQTVQYLLLLLQQKVIGYSCWQYNFIINFQLTNDLNE